MNKIFKVGMGWSALTATYAAGQVVGPGKEPLQKAPDLMGEFFAVLGRFDADGTTVADPFNFTRVLRSGDRLHPHDFCDAFGLQGLMAEFEPLALGDREHDTYGSSQRQILAEPVA